MPITPIDCSNMIIYKIQHNDKPELLYIGSTTNFKMRKYRHKSNCYNENGARYNTLIYKMIRNNGGWNSFSMIQIKEFPCNNQREAEAEEYRLMHELKSSMNVNKYSSENRKEQSKEYKEINKENKQLSKKYDDLFKNNEKTENKYNDLSRINKELILD